MQDLKKKTQLSQELQGCKAQLEAALDAAGGDTEIPSDNTYFKKISSVRRAYKSDKDIADSAGLDQDKQHLLRQLKAGERVLMKVHQERNKLQDANT